MARRMGPLRRVFRAVSGPFEGIRTRRRIRRRLRQYAGYNRPARRRRRR